MGRISSLFRITNPTSDPLLGYSWVIDIIDISLQVAKITKIFNIPKYISKKFIF
nr:MAG TPA: hypothetical protein [Crassvirales sp.]